MIVNAGYRGKVGAGAPKFTYTGTYNVRDDGVVELLTSGTLVFLNPAVVDVFMVGGGSSGAYQVTTNANKYTGGSGGYTRTIKKVPVSKGVQIPVTIGSGGIRGSNGGSSAFKEFTVNGGTAPSNTSSGEGGCGGGAGGWSNRRGGGAGGSDGSSGAVVDTGSGGKAGSGQGSTTREFGETTGKLYAGGGGGATFAYSSNPPAGGAGGDGGGGKGAACGEKSSSANIAGASGVDNTGGGGGGGGQTTNGNAWVNPGNGGSGIVCFRAAQ